MAKYCAALTRMSNRPSTAAAAVAASMSSRLATLAFTNSAVPSRGLDQPDALTTLVLVQVHDRHPRTLGSELTGNRPPQPCAPPVTRAFRLFKRDKVEPPRLNS